MSQNTPYPTTKQRSQKANMSIMQRVDDPNLKRAKLQLRDDLDNGATGFSLIFEGANNAYGYGLLATAETFSTLFDDIELDGLHIRLDSHPNGRIIADNFIDYLQKRRTNPNRTKLTFSIDPTSVLATTGKLKMSIEALKASLPQSMSGFFTSGLPGIVLEADGRPYHNAGATPEIEIGAMLSVALGHIRMVESARHHIIYALPHIGFALALDQDPILGQFKIQAVQELWQRLQEECGISSTFPATIHAETSMRMMTKCDAYNNISRGAFAALPAKQCGIASLTILPHSFVFGLPDANARRIARNSALILTKETSLSSYNAATSQHGYFEEFVERAWQEFKKFENEGGVMQSLIDGNLAKYINEARDLQLARLHSGEKNLIGSSLYIKEPDKANHILTEKAKPYMAEGIPHCQALSQGRFEEELQNSPQIAPIEH